MHVPESHTPPTSFRQFRREYAMIVLSILTALGFERAAVYAHDRAAAQESRARIEQEISDDLSELRKAVAANSASAAVTRAALKSLLDMMKSATPDKAKESQLITDALQKSLSLQLPSWQRDAWDAAVADQTVTHLDPRDLRHYAELYSGALDMNDAVHILLSGGIFDRVADLSVDLRLGDANPLEGARVMARFLSTAQQIVAAQQTLLATGGDKAKPGGG